MTSSPVELVPQGVLDADEHRFGNRRLNNLVGATGLDKGVVRRFCTWFVGHEHGWKSEFGDGKWHDEGQRPNRFSTGQLADHLAGRTSPPNYRYSLHLRAKALWIPEEGWRFWTYHLMIDLDDRASAVQSLQERYVTCRRLFGTPAVLRTPRRGLHLYWPLAVPVFLDGFICRGHGGPAPVIPPLLRVAGLVVEPGNLELLPTGTQTLRLPLGGTGVQLDPDTLEPLPAIGRAAEVTRWVETVDHLLAQSPLDARAVEVPAVATAPSRLRAWTWRDRNAGPLGPHTEDEPDVRRLLTEGLYPGLSRHTAALALARHWRLGRGWTGERCVEKLLQWTRTKTNGRSGEASRLERGGSEQVLRREYERMVEGMERAIVAGHLVARPRRKGAEAIARLTPVEVERVFTAANATPGAVRYWDEVFACCVLSFAKRHGTPGPDLPDGRGLQPVFAELSAVMMQQWPSAAGAAYKRRLERLRHAGIVVLERTHRPPRSNRPGRARTYRVEVDLDGLPACQANGRALLETSDAVQEMHGVRAHPQQVEHALIASSRWMPKELRSRYGRAAARRIAALVAAYRDAVGAEVTNTAAA